ncbi:uncharacterized protein LOC143725962 isoform X11 [Siphateles boraxobius]|uniref:uncharacterized protein LOC143725962 isoform X11 n=1 Tax=Siphateles boraxobius TaxID=180520 RepID=UPI004063D63D
MGNEQSTQKKRPKTNAEQKVTNGELNGHAVPTPDGSELVASKAAAVEQKCETPPVTITKKPPKKEEVDSCKLNGPKHVETTPEEKNTVAKDAEPPKTVPKPSEDEVTNFFGKMFKKKSEPVKPASKSNDSVDAPVTAVDLKIDLQPDPVDIKTSAEPEPEPEPEGKTLEPSPVEVTEENNPPEDIKAAEKSVMNFFKTFVTPTKTSKEAKATPDASKEQVQETPKAPPPPPAPPKMESKAEPVVKKEETSATKAAAATKAEGSAKTKTKDSSFSKLFRPKPVVVEEKKPVEVQVDASKSSTLEASAKPEEPPAPKPEEKKQEKKSTFGKMFKPKVLLGQVSTRIQAAASSAAASISLMSARSAPEAKNETPAPPPVAEAAPVVKAKEEPKPAIPAPQTAPDNKSIGSTDNSSPNMPRKLEKRNSLQLFFKNLGQKRQSDAGVQTDPVAPEKSK